MRDQHKTKRELVEELQQLRPQVAELEKLETERKLAEQTLRKAHDELERRVEKRTAELLNTNEQLKQQIEECKKVEEALIATNAQLEVLLAASPAVIYKFEPGDDYAATFVSANIKRQLGYAPEEFTEDSQFWANNIHRKMRRASLLIY